MNEFLEQFLIEARELVEQGTQDLLAFEERPDDKERLDGAFRAFHTLKGAAAIIEFPEMERVMHAGEDALARVRTAGRAVTPRLVGDCLTCIDQVIAWLDIIQESGDLPAGAAAEADALVQRFSAAASTFPGDEPARGPAAEWLRELIARHAGPASKAKTAVRWVPDRDSFFRGEDPLGVLQQVPGLLALDIQREGSWSRLDAFDPFVCQLAILALAAGDGDEVAGQLHGLGGTVEIRVVRAPSAGMSDGLSEAARALLEAQLELIATRSGDGDAGRVASAARVAANVLRHAGRGGESDTIEQARVAAGGAADPRGVVACIEAALHGTSEAPSGDAAATTRAAPEPVARALRVDVEKLDELVRLTGELTVAKNVIGHAVALSREEAKTTALAAQLRDHHALLDRLVTELQGVVLGLRVLPLRHVFQRFSRLVREMALSLGKPARLLTEGEETEADKAIVENLFEPLVHAVRNAVDHGIELPDARRAAGKAAVATIVLRAMRQGEHVIIEVEDDGRGIDPVRLRQVAAERGIAPAEALATMTDEEALELVFLPGFSTAFAVSGLSGRGVGMDAVRSAVERLGGRVALRSRLGEGTMVRFTLPFTVMMTRVMTVEAGGQVFGIPLESVVETVRVGMDQIHPVGAARAFFLRNRTVPLVGLAETLGASPEPADGSGANVVVATAGGQLCGLEVDRFGERLDVMLKPVEGLLRGLPGITGTTLLGDGRVLIVLDVREVMG